MKYLIALLYFFVFFLQPVFGQFPKTDFFGAPLDIPLYLSGNFGELRSNHFHTGIDIKTGGVVGKNVLAAADGRVARIAVSPYGYGKAIYIDHEDGMQTVYGHLLSFNDEIGKVVKAKQYEEESFSVDFSPSDNIYVTKGEVIALSGNSGSSGGPHLHFEIRKGIKPQNPLKFGFDVKDNIPPRIRGLRFHPLSPDATVNGKHGAQSFVVTGNSGSYKLRNGGSVNIRGDFGISVHTLDFLNDVPNKCGVYSVQLFIDSVLICEQKFDELDFSTNRHINCYKDFEVYHTNGWHYHKSFIEPGNELEIYTPNVVDSGVLSGMAPGEHSGLYLIEDVYGNKSELPFSFSTEAEDPTADFRGDYDAFFKWDAPNSYEFQDEIKIDIPAKALYSNLYFDFGREVQKPPFQTALYSLNNKYIPLDKSMEIQFNVSDILPDKREKIVAVRYSPEGYRSYINGFVNGDIFRLKSRLFGKYSLVLDEENPELKPYKNSAGGHIPARGKLYYSVKDDKSGIETYRAELNGKWVLLEYNPKKGRFELDIEESGFEKGNNTLEISVRDGVGNTVTESYLYIF